MTDPTPATESTADDARLPRDPDLDAEQTRSGTARPVHLRPVFLVLVFIGGTLGTAAREGLSLAFPPVNGVPYAIFGINVAGAFLLGFLLDALARRGPDRGRRRALRLLLGTGFMGGFTTYSALATDTAGLLGTGAPGAGIGYALGTVLVGAIATWAGIAVAAAIRQPVDTHGEER